MNNSNQSPTFVRFTTHRRKNTYSPRECCREWAGMHLQFRESTECQFFVFCHIHFVVVVEKLREIAFDRLKMCIFEWFPCVATTSKNNHANCVVLGRCNINGLSSTASVYTKWKQNVFAMFRSYTKQLTITRWAKCKNENERKKTTERERKQHLYSPRSSVRRAASHNFSFVPYKTYANLFTMHTAHMLRISSRWTRMCVSFAPFASCASFDCTCLSAGICRILRRTTDMHLLQKPRVFNILFFSSFSSVVFFHDAENSSTDNRVIRTYAWTSFGIGTLSLVPDWTGFELHSQTLAQPINFDFSLNLCRNLLIGNSIGTSYILALANNSTPMVFTVLSFTFEITFTLHSLTHTSDFIHSIRTKCYLLIFFGFFWIGKSKLAPQRSSRAQRETNALQYRNSVGNTQESKSKNTIHMKCQTNTIKRFSNDKSKSWIAI